ncbi:MAG: cytochrome c maturation protein CcmE [Armatimonadota bacterium]
MKSYYVIAGVIILAFLALGVSTFMSSMTPYVEDFSKVRASTEEIIQVPGDIVKGRTEYDVKNHALVFYLKDAKKSEMKVIYNGTAPANFDHAKKVVVSGKYRNGMFEASELKAKCPSKYQPN